MDPPNGLEERGAGAIFNPNGAARKGARTLRYRGSKMHPAPAVGNSERLDGLNQLDLENTSYGDVA
jgi:hypothetical protein